MAGKKIFMLLLLLITLFNLSKCQSDESVFIKGGILFEKAQAASVYINPPTALFNKYINYSSFEDTLIQAKIFESSYTNFCDTLNEKLAERVKKHENKFFASNDHHRLTNAQDYCRARDAQLPEIKNMADFRDIVRLARINDIDLIVAGVYADDDSNTFKFISDNSPAYDGYLPFPGVHVRDNSTLPYKKCWQGKFGGYKDDPGCIQYRKDSYGMAYIRGISAREFDLAVLDKTYKESSFKVICERTRPASEHDIILRLAAHSCKRDQINVVKASQLIYEEATRFTQLNATRIDEMVEIFAAQRRYKRHVDIAYSMFSHTLPDVTQFFNLYEHEFYSTRYTKMKELLEMVNSLSADLSEELEIPDSIIANIFLWNLLHNAQIIDEINYYDICNLHSPLYGVNHNALSDDILRLIQFTNVISDNCRHWYYFSDYDLFRSSNQIYNTIVMRSIPIIHKFYNLDFNQELSIDGTNLTSFNEMMKDKAILFYNEMEKMNFFNQSTGKFTSDLLDFIHTNMSLPNTKLNLEKDLKRFSMRRKRYAFLTPLLLGGGALTMGSLAINDINEGSPALNFIGKAMSAATGLVHRDDLKPQLELMKKHSQALEALSVNQKEIEKALESITNSINMMDQFTKTLEFSTIVMFQEFDHKMALQEIINVVQSTILKIASIKSNARNFITSPYLLSKNELNLIAAQYRINGVQLSSDINDVFTQVLEADNSLLYTLRVPILNDKNLHHVYRATAIPLFKGDRVFKVKQDTTYIAYAASSRKYSILSEEEYMKCKQNKYCQTVDVERPITENSHCVMRSLDTGRQECPMIEIEEKEPFYYVYSNKLIYSIKGPEMANLICKHNGKHNKSIAHLEGMGTASIAPGCNVILQNRMEIYIHPEAKQTDLGEVKFMEIHRLIPRSDEYNFKVTERVNQTFKIYTPDITPIDTDMFSKIMQEIVNPEQALPEVFRVLTGILIAVLIFVFICTCFPKVGIWFKTCIFWKNPKTWWVDIQQYDLATFNKMRKEATNEMKKNIANFVHNNRNIFRKPIEKKSDNDNGTELDPMPLISQKQLHQKLEKDIVSSEDIIKSVLEELKKDEFSPTFSRKDMSPLSTIRSPYNTRSKSYLTETPLNKAEKAMEEAQVHHPPIKQVYPTFSYVEVPQNYYPESSAPPETGEFYVRNTIVLDQPEYIQQ